ncbi:MAG: putative molybdenum carrier protein [Rhodospirillales bacterium]|mgnify:CR=1 FL=1|nr:putative molybdenum carrier protein [Rhodospirillales bacterium]
MGGVAKIVSGGQTGVDRAALDTALTLGLACGGWCPLGRRAEDGPIPERYPLIESESPKYRIRTGLNVRDSDATLVLCRGEPSGGSALTVRLAKGLGRPVLVIDPDAPDSALVFGDWAEAEAIAVLNVAGPRESTEPGAYRQARAFLTRVLG